MSLSITTAQATDGSIIVMAEGEIDVSCASELREAINEALASDAGVVTVDLAQVPYIDSTGIGVLVGAAHRAEDAGAAFTVANPQRNVRRVLDLLGVTGELGIDSPKA